MDTMSKSMEGMLLSQNKEVIYEENSIEILYTILHYVPDEYVTDKIDKPRTRYYYHENHDSNFPCWEDIVLFEKEIKFDDKMISELKVKVPEYLSKDLQDNFNKLIGEIENQYKIDADCTFYLILSN